MIFLRIFCFIGLILLGITLTLLHKSLLLEYEKLSKFPISSDIKIAFKFGKGILLFFYIVVIATLCLLIT